METSLPTPICQGPTVNLPEGNRHVSMIIWPWGMQVFGDIRDGLTSFVSDLTDSQEASASKLHHGFGLAWWNKQMLVGGWPTPLKNMTSSVGMMTFPRYGKIYNSCSKPPTSESSEIGCLIYLVLCCKQIVRWFTRWASAALGHQTDTWVLKFSAKTRKTKLKSGLAGLGEIKGNQTGWWFCDLDLQEISRDPTIHPQVQAKLKWHLEIVRGTSKAMFKEPKLAATPVDVPRTQLSIQSLKFSAGAEMEWDLGLRCYESQKGRTTICFNKKSDAAELPKSTIQVSNRIQVRSIPRISRVQRHSFVQIWRIPQQKSFRCSNTIRSFFKKWLKKHKPNRIFTQLEPTDNLIFPVKHLPDPSFKALRRPST